ncbi:MAG TPA: arsinothricin resistance N-acetyltransferase ArsN1 family B [Candidatus Elarobacter sp.]|nr:arsinothricin resistance N-acetyltransferase ArsN1 family B [Candidatus Elarobacter sp.]
MHVRLAISDDAAAVAAIYRPIVETTTISFEEVAPDEAEMRARIDRTLQTYPWLVAEESGGVLGYAYASRWRERAAYRWSVETTAYVHERARGRGVGSALYEALFRVLDAQGFHRAYAGITLPNDASVALHTAVGFLPAGVFHDAGCKFGRWCDVAWFERPLAAAEIVPPNETIPLPRLPARALHGALGG